MRARRKCVIKKAVFFMATIEERLTAIEHDHAELKQKMELQTIAIGALVNKTALEKLNEKNDNIFNALMAHDQFTNQQLAELREKLEVEVEGKIAGLQTEMRQGFQAVNSRLTELDQGFHAVNNRLEAHDARFDRLENMLAQVLRRLPEK